MGETGEEARASRRSKVRSSRARLPHSDRGEGAEEAEGFNGTSAMMRTDAVVCEQKQRGRSQTFTCSSALSSRCSFQCTRPGSWTHV